MKNMPIFLLVIFIFLSLILSATNEKQKPRAEAKIEYNNGVKVIKNPKAPLYGEIQLKLEEDLIIGEKQGNDSLFYRISDIEVNGDGKIFILDSGKHCIQVYDKKGQHIQTFGRKGQGPGDLEEPMNMYLDKEENIYISDRKKIHFFNKKGEFIKNIMLDFFIGDFAITPEKNILAQTSLFTSEGIKNELVLINPEGKKLRTIDSFCDKLDIIKKGGITLRHHNLYLPSLYFCLLNERLGIYGYSSEYKLFVFGLSGEIKYIIEKNEPLQPVTIKEKNRVIDKFIKAYPEYKFSKGKIKKFFNFPKYRPFYNRIMTDGEGDIYIRSFMSILDDKKDIRLDLFNQKGVYIYRIKLPQVPNIIKNGNIYKFKIEQETGEFLIKRYKIKNWNQLKNEKMM